MITIRAGIIDDNDDDDSKDTSKSEMRSLAVRMFYRISFRFCSISKHCWSKKKL